MCLWVPFFEDLGRESQYLRLFSGRCPTRKNAVLFERTKLRPQYAEPSRPAPIYYQLQLQHGLECEESYWAGVLVQGSKPHIAADTHFPSTFSIVFG